jgi:hypothetical protein
MNRCRNRIGVGIALLFVVGCGQATDAPATHQTRHEIARQAASAPQAHSHDGWWCEEHGVPEDVCGLCDAKLAAKFQKEGDWCKAHDRPDSQCFLCHPEYEKRFAAQYEAKFGVQPPKPQG